MPSQRLSVSVYRVLLKLYPPGFREDYAGPMEKEFRDELAESSGMGNIAMLWIRLLVDLAVSVPRQVSREVRQDLRHTLRHWSKHPWQAGFAISALALAIGANTGVFSVVNALLLRALPFRDPGRLALLHQFIPPHITAKQFHAWRQQSVFSADTALLEEFDVNLGGLRVGSRAHVAQTSENFFSVLGVQPVLGRGFAPEDDVDGTGWGLSGRNAVAVIAYGLWQNLFGGDAKVLGATIRVDGNPLTVVGVALHGFDYPGKAVLWKPAAFSPGNNGWGAVSRLKPGISWPQAQAAFLLEAKRLLPESEGDRDLQPRMTSLQDGLAGPVKEASLLFMGAVLLVLLIAGNECRESLACSHRRPGRRVLPTIGAGRQPCETGASVTHRVPIPFFRSGGGRIVAGMVHDVSDSKRSAAALGHAVVFGSGLARPRLYADRVRYDCIPVRCFAIVVRWPHPSSSHTSLQCDTQIAKVT